MCGCVKQQTHVPGALLTAEEQKKSGLTKKINTIDPGMYEQDKC